MAKGSRRKAHGTGEFLQKRMLQERGFLWASAADLHTRRYLATCRRPQPLCTPLGWGGRKAQTRVVEPDCGTQEPPQQEEGREDTSPQLCFTVNALSLPFPS